MMRRSARRPAPARSNSFGDPPQISHDPQGRDRAQHLARAARQTQANVRSWRKPHEIDMREDRHPYDIEGMPEQAETYQPSKNVVPEPLCEYLRHHRTQPEKPDGHVQAVATHEREER